MSIIAQRPPADKPGPDVVDSVLTTEAALTERGAHEINKSADKVDVQATLVKGTYIEAGERIDIVYKGQLIRGITQDFSFQVKISDKDITNTVSLSVEAVE